MSDLMSDLMVGDSVQLLDYSYCMAVNSQGDLVSTGHARFAPPEKFKIVAVNCTLPTTKSGIGAGYENTIILVEKTSKRVLYVPWEFVKVEEKPEPYAKVDTDALRSVLVALGWTPPKHKKPAPLYFSCD